MPPIPDLPVDPGNIAPRYPNQPAFQVRRQVYDGDFVRGPGGWKAAIRYGARFPEGLGTSLLVSQPEGYDSIKLWWGIPPEALKDTWTYMAIVRSGFGHPTTPTDGEVIVGLDGNRPDDEIPGAVVDSGLPPGQWFYYTLMFRVGTRWYPINYTQQVVTIDYGHRQALYDQTPPFYQEVDSEMYAGSSSSMLERWFWTIGYDLDLTRTLTEGIDRIYDADRSPQALLEPLGEQNLGLVRSEPLGDIRYRGVVAQSQDILSQRGTYGGLRTFVEAATQYNAYVSPGLNLMLLDDDARFANGKGNWSPSHFGLNTALAADPDLNYTIDPITSRQLTFETGPSGVLPDGIVAYPPELAQSNYPVSTCTKIQAGAAASEHLVVACGVGQQVTIEARDEYVLGAGSGTVSSTVPVAREKVYRLTHLNPLYRGIVVDEAETYYFSFWMCAPEGSTESYRVNFGFAYYPRDLPNVGFSDAFNSAGISSYHQIEPLSIDMVKSNLIQNADEDQWYRYILSSTVPAGARFAVPVVWVTGANGEKISTPRYMTAAMVNLSQGAAAGTLFRPDYYFRVTADDASYQIGTGSNKVIGEP